MSKTVSKQPGTRAVKPAHQKARSRVSSSIMMDDPAVTVVPQARPRRQSEDFEQLFIDLTQRAPAPAVGPSHWWG